MSSKREDVSSILDLLSKGIGSLSMMSPIVLVQGGQSGGSHLESCVIRRYHQTLKASSVD